MVVKSCQQDSLSTAPHGRWWCVEEMRTEKDHYFLYDSYSSYYLLSTRVVDRRNRKRYQTLALDSLPH